MEKFEIEEKIVAMLKNCVRSGNPGECIRSWADL